MKSTQEFRNTVFAKAERYEAKRRAVRRSGIACAACFAIVLLAMPILITLTMRANEADPADPCPTYGAKASLIRVEDGVTEQKPEEKATEEVSLNAVTTEADASETFAETAAASTCATTPVTPAIFTDVRFASSVPIAWNDAPLTEVTTAWICDAEDLFAVLSPADVNALLLPDDFFETARILLLKSLAPQEKYPFIQTTSDTIRISMADGEAAPEGMEISQAFVIAVYSAASPTVEIAE